MAVLDRMKEILQPVVLRKPLAFLWGNDCFYFTYFVWGLSIMKIMRFVLPISTRRNHDFTIYHFIG